MDMILNMTVHDPRSGRRNASRLQLDWDRKEWSVPAAQQQGWSGIGFSSKGAFELKSWGVMWLWDQAPGQKKRNTVIVWNPPTSEADALRLSGQARIYDPKDPAFKDARINWTVDLAARAATPKLARIRTEVKRLCEEILPAQIDTFLIPGSEKMRQISSSMFPAIPGFTNCGDFPGYIARKLNGDIKVKAAVPGIYPDPKNPGKYVKKSPILEISGSIIAMEGFAQAIDRIAMADPKYKGLRAWIPNDGIARPQTGDFYVLHKSAAKDSDFSHVGVIIDASGDKWITADSGQGQEDPNPKKEEKKYAKGMGAGFRYRNYKDGWLTGEPTQGPEKRYLRGWVNIDHPLLFPTWATKR
jgi:hypothetical protein